MNHLQILMLVHILQEIPSNDQRIICRSENCEFIRQKSGKALFLKVLDVHVTTSKKIYDPLMFKTMEKLIFLKNARFYL